MATETRALWQVVYDDLRSRIDQGSLQKGAQVPGEIALSEQHGVSRSTVRSALLRLEQEGLITAGKGRLGRTVREDEPLMWNLHAFERANRRDDPATGMDDWARGVADQGRTPHQEIKPSLEMAEPSVGKWLQVEAGTPVVRRSRRRTVDGRPWQLSDSWFPEWAKETVLLTHVEDLVLPGGALAHLGHPQVRTRDEIRVRMPSPTEAQHLEIPVGTPVMEHVRIGFGSDDIPVRAMVTVAPGDRTTLVYELEV
ncbi:GntR family transcriptional regulator [Kitasatospora sp. NPDC059811]|uniref:GntR family transcriptional regulator n=1 Tax=Streptomycetaceae TaxID=2062 RepID=UPI0007AFD5A7|nr:GntR family transcriptional regulator [Streptomyces sp. MJM8645]